MDNKRHPQSPSAIPIAMSNLAPSIIKAYSETDYCVTGEYHFTLQVGIFNETLMKVY